MKSAMYPVPTEPFKFERHEIIIHTKTSQLYRVTVLPDEAVIEKTWEPAYGYVSMNGGPTIFRSQEIMEDGRFVPYES